MIRFDHATKRYPDGTVAVDALSLEAPTGQITVLVGPSGCGKTTSLRMINRMIEPTEGRIWLDDTDTASMPAHELRRKIGYVIQHAGLFPHRTVLDNIGTVPRLLGWDKKRIQSRVDELMDTVGLDPALHGDRYPAQLSGGQRQRAGVARALAADPAVLLMDEPFSAVDPIVRERLQSEFLRLQETVRKTIVFVTHDIEEAVRIGDRIAVMSHGGHVEQFATPADLLGRPANAFVADFVGADRGLKRLSVTLIEKADIENPPVVHTTDRVAVATASLRAAGARWGVVLDDENRLHGWISADETGDGTVADRARRMEAWVPVGANLKMAFAEMLQHDAGWVAVLDGDRYVGVLTPATLHEALRRSVESDVLGVEPEDVELDRVPTV
jgi:osmoprotectant transport system ATP-binding protein